MATLTLNGKTFKPDPGRLIGAGGEAEVFDIGGGRAVKLFKGPDHPEFADSQNERESARVRLAEKGEKLRIFPTGLPHQVIVPGEHVFDRRTKEIRGYEMRLVGGAELLLRYGERSYRDGRFGAREVTHILRKLHSVVHALHERGIVIGDFNDLNVLVTGIEPYLVDADSFQFGRFRCPVFTERFIDPLLCIPRAPQLILQGTMNEQSDWYAFAVMVLRTLLYVEPYGGVFRPADPALNLPHAARPSHRVTIFHPEVRYPKPALPLDVLSEQLLEELRQILVHDRRGEFPVELLDPDEWTSCPQCGLEHTRRHCPSCSHLSPTAWQRVSTVRGSVECTHVMRTIGVVLNAALDGDVLRWLTFSNGDIQRENGSPVPAHVPVSGARTELAGRQTFIARGGAAMLMTPEGGCERLPVDFGLNGPLFASSGARFVYASQGTLFRRTAVGDERIGSIVSRQAMLWAGNQLGFGFYRASGFVTGFIFDLSRGGLDDTVRLPWLRGQVIRAQCAFGKNCLWFHAVVSDHGRVGHHLSALDRYGKLLGHLTVFEGDPNANSFDTWLTGIGGICCAGDLLLAATDEGLIRAELFPVTASSSPGIGAHRSSKLRTAVAKSSSAPPRPGSKPEEQSAYRVAVTKAFPDTAPFVDSGCKLIAMPAGVYVVDGKEIRLLTLR